MSLTNPGTIGTQQSVPRLMPGQGLIVGVGSLDYPTEWKAADPVTLADLGVSKVITISSTYDHRIIQGAESGLFLKRVEELLLGADGFYDEVFRALGVPYEAVQWRRDVNPIDREQAMLEKQMAVANLIRVHRVRGHLIADLDPLRWKEPDMPVELDPATYGLTHLGPRPRVPHRRARRAASAWPLGDILHVLRDAYCRTIGIEYMHIQDPEEQRWIQEQVEGVSPELDLDDQRYILERLNAAEAFEKFLATKYVGQKRFGLEGAESAIPILDAILEAAADADLDGSVIGMPHRGRLNVLTNIVGKSYDQLFKEFEGQVDPESMQGSGDVKYHLGQVGKFVARSGKDITVELAANPSHLEAVDPVVVGMARAKQDAINDPEAFSVLPILMHGDAAFAGQGVVAETLNMSDIKGYRVGGTIHVVVNNQIGFTTTPESARSGFYSTDVAKIIQAPIFHVNGDDPEACVRVARLAFAYRQRFHKDVVIDMVCYRRHGHNEGDDPSYTQPMMYAKIDAAPLGAEAVHRVAGEAGPALARGGRGRARRLPEAAADRARRDAPERARQRGAWPRRRRRRSACCPTSRPAWRSDVLDRIYATLSTCARHLPGAPQAAQAVRGARQAVGRRRGRLGAGRGDGLRLAAARGHRPAHRRPGHPPRHVQPPPRRARRPHQRRRVRAARPPRARAGQVLDLRLAAVGVRRRSGSSTATRWSPRSRSWSGRRSSATSGTVPPRSSTSSSWPAEDKWNQTERPRAVPAARLRGPGPEHSSARVERFLTLCAEDNIQVANCTQASQIFHLLRRQVRRSRPQAAGRSSRRSRCCGPSRCARRSTSCCSGHFRETIDDAGVADPAAVRRIVLTTGKVGHEAHRGARRRRRAGGGRARRPALPVALRAARRDRGPLPERHRPRVAPGGAREHGRVELREGPPLRALRRQPPDPPRVPLRVRQPRHRLARRPRPGAGPAPRRRPRPVARRLRRRGSRRCFELGEGRRRGRRP